MNKNYKIDGTAAIPNISLQLFPHNKAIMLEDNYPILIAITKDATIVPLTVIGDISDK